MPHMTPMKASKAVRAFLSAAGRKGGLVTSEAKRKSCIANAKRPRPNRRKRDDSAS